MDSETLFRMYEAEFKGSVWIWTDGFMNYNASIIKPVKEGKGYQIEPYDFNEFLQLDPEEEEYYKSLGEDIIELNALEYPDLYMRVRINRRSRELVDKILDIMDEFHQMPGFKEVVVGLDYTNDASGFVKWRNHRTDYIL
jgi:methionyl-tRNA synthetase